MTYFIPNMANSIILRAFRPERLPLSWEERPSHLEGAAFFVRDNLTSLAVFASVDMMFDNAGKSCEWIHLSVSRQAKLPSWDDLKDVKGTFLGDHREAVQVLPKAEDYINLHPFCLHLWAPVVDIKT
ncbi:hypothetical protein [Maridesulfovibrio sp.]|uniref:DUF7694 domain-containing protein n=1 Tax=Maridesulfovibrio sp. TaxID=2795000 RepID=UPI0029C9CFF5|nr:hypothetical protein [Maridesulfovibrio sp.]